MWGAIIGDLAGSVYEYEQINEIKSINTNELIPDKSFFSDDTILTIAIAEAIQTDKDYENEFSEELSTDYRQLQLEKNQTKVYTSKPKKTNKGKDCK